MEFILVIIAVVVILGVGYNLWLKKYQQDKEKVAEPVITDSTTVSAPAPAPAQEPVVAEPIVAIKAKKPRKPRTTKATKAEKSAKKASKKKTNR